MYFLRWIMYILGCSLPPPPAPLNWGKGGGWRERKTTSLLLLLLHLILLPILSPPQVILPTSLYIYRTTFSFHSAVSKPMQKEMIAPLKKGFFYFVQQHSSAGIRTTGFLAPTPEPKPVGGPDRATDLRRRGNCDQTSSSSAPIFPPLLLPLQRWQGGERMFRLLFWDCCLQVDTVCLSGQMWWPDSFFSSPPLWVLWGGSSYQFVSSPLRSQEVPPPPPRPTFLLSPVSLLLHALLLAVMAF